MKRTFYRSITILTVAILTITTSAAQHKIDSIEAVVQRLSEALSKADRSLIISDLSPVFAVNIASWPSSEFHLSSIIDSKLIESVAMESVISSTADTILVSATFQLTDSKTDKSVIALDKQNRILYVDLFDRLYGPSRYDKSVKKGIIKFTLQNGSIIIPLRINNSDKVYKFLFDSGADGMAIRKSIADSIGLTISHSQTAGVVGGSMEINISKNNTIHLSDSIRLEGQNMAVFEQVGDNTDGIIGLNLARKFILEVHMDNQEILLHTPGDYQFKAAGETINITVPGGVMILPATINMVGKTDTPGKFAFDTGAHYYLIGFEQFVRKNRLLLTGFKPEETASTLSMGVVSPVFMGKTASFTIGKTIRFVDMPISLMGSTGRKYPSDLPDGSIGIKLISQYNFTIDLIRKLIHLTPITEK